MKNAKSVELPNKKSAMNFPAIGGSENQRVIHEPIKITKQFFLRFKFYFSIENIFFVFFFVIGRKHRIANWCLKEWDNTILT